MLNLQKVVSLMAALALMSGLAFAQESGTSTGASPFEGKSFAGKVMNKGETQGDPDTLIFKDGKLRSTACEKYGFTSSNYKTMDRDGKTTFEAELTNPSGAKMAWTGTLENNQIQATAIWTKEGEANKQMTFMGKEKITKKAKK